MRDDITTAPLGTSKDGKPVYLRDVWPSNQEIADILASSLSRDQFLKRYGEVFKGAAAVAGDRRRPPMPRPTGGTTAPPT